MRPDNYLAGKRMHALAAVIVGPDPAPVEF